MSMSGEGQGPRIEYPKKPVTIHNLAELNKYDGVTHVLRLLLRNGELADYDDELANRVKDAIEIVEGVCKLNQEEILLEEFDNRRISRLQRTLLEARHYVQSDAMEPRRAELLAEIDDQLPAGD